jgi:hypothetical protein
LYSFLPSFLPSCAFPANYSYLTHPLFIYLSFFPVLLPGILSGIALGYGLDDLEFESGQRLGILLSTTASGTAPIQWVAGALSLRAKRPECEADH